MRTFIAILGVSILGALGCHHVGGKCDCGPQPGESAGYAPYHSTVPTNVAPPGTVVTPPVAMPAK